MRKICLLLLLCLAPMLTGCGSLYNERRELETLRLAETLGLDPAPGGVLLSLAASSGAGDETPCCFSGVGASLSEALEALRRRSLEAELFCGHLQHVLVGEAFARQGLDALLAAVCRSSDLRLDMPIYLVLDAAALDALSSSGDGKTSASDTLTSLGRGREASTLSSAGAILRDLDRQGCALIRSLRLQPSAETDPSVYTLVPEGFGILVDGKLRELIGPEDAFAAELLADTLTPCPLVLRDVQGRTVTVELQSGGTKLRPLWGEDGSLAGLELRVRVEAVVLEIDGFTQVADEGSLNALTARLEAELSRRIGRVLRLSRDLEADFLGLGPRLEQLSPGRCRGLDRELGTLLPELTLRLVVQGELRHSNDIN